MIEVWREPEVRVQSGGGSIVFTTSDTSSVLADSPAAEKPVCELGWLSAPRMNGYNVHDGVAEETRELK